MTEAQIKKFRDTILAFYSKNRRSLPWRETRDPYKIWVSEIMLQQTGVARVMPKYEAFLKKFPTIESLANSSFNEVLALWIGLGYNNRALRMRDAGKIIMEKHKGKFPLSFDDAVSLPGIGPYTAKAILCFSKNEPSAFIETNIRDVYLHHFFNGKTNVSDKEILNLVEETLPKENPRDWYYALMDYGTFLKESGKSSLSQSKAYKKQSAFKGSVREKRAMIIRLLLKKGMSKTGLSKETAIPEKVLDPILASLVKDKAVSKKGKIYSLAG